MKVQADILLFSAPIIENIVYFLHEWNASVTKIHQANETFQEQLFHVHITMLQHRSAFHIRSVQMSTERKCAVWDPYLLPFVQLLSCGDIYIITCILEPVQSEWFILSYKIRL